METHSHPLVGAIDQEFGDDLASFTDEERDELLGLLIFSLESGSPVADGFVAFTLSGEWFTDRDRLDVARNLCDRLEDEVSRRNDADNRVIFSNLVGYVRAMGANV